jgi:hypothetical protein
MIPRKLTVAFDAFIASLKPVPHSMTGQERARLLVRLVDGAARDLASHAREQGLSEEELGNIFGSQGFSELIRRVAEHVGLDFDTARNAILSSKRTHGFGREGRSQGGPGSRRKTKGSSPWNSATGKDDARMTDQNLWVLEVRRGVILYHNQPSRARDGWHWGPDGHPFAGGPFASYDLAVADARRAVGHIMDFRLLVLDGVAEIPAGGHIIVINTRGRLWIKTGEKPARGGWTLPQ